MKCCVCNHNVRASKEERLYFLNTGAYSPAYYYQQEELDNEDMEKYKLSKGDWNHYICPDCLFNIQDMKRNSKLPLSWTVRVRR